MRPLALIASLLVLTACQNRPVEAPSDKVAVMQGQSIAQMSCASCHAVGPPVTSSPNPDAPPFVEVVNREGLTGDTLSAWLKDAHNYPAEMEIELDEAKVSLLVVYMLTLRDPDYTPPVN